MAIREIISYDIKTYNFREIIQEMLDTSKLEEIHNFVDYEVFTLDNDQSSAFHRKFYGHCDKNPQFDDLYVDFIKNYISTYFNDKNLIFQKRPTFRIHYNNNLAVAEFHRDSNYNHPIQEVNFFLPVTDCWDTNTIWIESEDGKADYSPVRLKYGQIFVFNGGMLTHGNKINKTGSSRISFDFRCLRSDHERELNSNSDGSSEKTKKKFIIGDYYDKL